MSAASAQGRGSGRSSPAKRQSTTKRQPQPANRNGTKSLGAAVHAAMQQFAELTGRTPDSVTGARSLENGDGWSVLVDVVELERIPASTSVLATYRVDLDGEGSITGYERLRRYTRGATDAT
ncbi:MAG TPA: gas vesicle protein [Nocardioidaceae bacterium]|nr:gas vesicle protein [Nocardioidaceae bacterium]